MVFLLLLLVDQISVHYGLTGWQRTGDNILGGVFVGVLLFVDQRHRHRYLAERLETIGLMNHHVRNALQAIKYARYSHDDVRVIEDSVARIEWALREILPGAESSASLHCVRMQVEGSLQPVKSPVRGETNVGFRQQ